jgi:demethylmenaquinone methyltransferase/2-methoxy-6-polyprenyl-1,4-benzoquinol methylase
MLGRRLAFEGTAHDKERYVRNMFGRIAGHYDQMNTLMTLGRHHAWRRRAARLADPPLGRPALDLCCGTGEQALELARLGRGPVVGIDFARPMLHLAREKARRAGLSGVASFQEADALHLPFAAGAFSCAATTFSLRNVTDVPGLLAEMRRVVAPGGRIVTTELLGPPRGPLASLGRLYQRLVVPALGAVFSGDSDAYAYLPESTGIAPSAEGMTRLMEEAGLSHVSYLSLALGSVAIHVGERSP